MGQNEPILEREVPLEVTELTLSPVEIWQGPGFAWLRIGDHVGRSWGLRSSGIEWGSVPDRIAAGVGD